MRAKILRMCPPMGPTMRGDDFCAALLFTEQEHSIQDALLSSRTLSLPSHA